MTALLLVLALQTQPQPLEAPPMTAPPVVQADAEAPPAALEGPKAAPPRVDPGPCGTLETPTCSLFWLPLGSVILPGLGEAIDGRLAWPYATAASVSLIGAVGLSLEANASGITPGNVEGDARLPRDLTFQAILAFTQGYQTTGFLSAYDTYVHRMRTLGMETEHQGVGALLAAPFDWRPLTNPWVVVPLLGALGLGAYQLVAARQAGLPLFRGYRWNDGVFSASLAWQAGVSEEAFFRGFGQSYLEHRWGWHPWAANATQALVFGAAHFQGASTPELLVQSLVSVGFATALGLYNGWLTMRADYDLTDAIFLHTWWDAIVVTAAFAASPRNPPTAYISLPTLRFY